MTQVGQIVNMFAKTQNGYGRAPKLALSIPLSEQIQPNQRWRVVGCRFFLTPNVYSNVGNAQTNFSLEDQDGFQFVTDFSEMPGVAPATFQAAPSYSSPWYTFQEGLMGRQLGADLRFRFNNDAFSVGQVLGNGYACVAVSARLETNDD